MISRRAQTSVEFLLLVAFGTLIFVVFFAVIQDRIVAANTQESGDQLDRLNTLIVSEFELAQRFSNGYERTFWLPTSAGGLNFNATILSNKTLVLESGGVTNLYFFSYPVHGQLNPGKNKVLSVLDEVYLNQNISEIINVKIDGDDSDWDSIVEWYGILPVSDIRNDEYSEVGATAFVWDLKRAMLWNDQVNLYIYLELYDNNIMDFGKGPSNDVVDFLILLDTDKNTATGYSSNNYAKVKLDQGADLLIPDYFGAIDKTSWELHIAQGIFFTSSFPYDFEGSLNSNFDFDKGAFTSQNYRYAYIGSDAMEMKISLSSLGLYAVDEKVIGYTIITRVNSTGVSDYLPGSYDSFSGGYYKIQNR